MLLRREYDVIVVGGGAAGFAAAAGASKAGARCLLIERNGSFGGQATNSNVASYCGFFTREEQPQRAVNGIGGELIERLMAIGGCTYRLSSTGNSIYTFDEELLKFAFDEMVREYRLDALLHCHMISAEVSADVRRIERIRCVDDENEYEFSAACFVDASGDANLASKAGAVCRFRSGSGNGYPTSRIMRIDHVRPGLNCSPAFLEQVVRQAKTDGYLHLTREAGIMFYTHEDTVYAIFPSTDIPSLDAATLTACEMDTRRQCQAYMQVFRKYIPGMENARLVSSGAKLGIRDSRHVAGRYEITKDDVLGSARFDDSVARGAWPCEIHDSLAGRSKYLYIRDKGYFSIPLRALHSKDICNLFCGGRTISADPEAYGSIRVMGTGFATGHAAGVAAALTAGNGDYETSCETVKAVQEELIRQNALI